MKLQCLRVYHVAQNNLWLPDEIPAQGLPFVKSTRPQVGSQWCDVDILWGLPRDGAAKVLR